MSGRYSCFASQEEGVYICPYVRCRGFPPAFLLVLERIPSHADAWPIARDAGANEMFLNSFRLAIVPVV